MVPLGFEPIELLSLMLMLERLARMMNGAAPPDGRAHSRCFNRRSVLVALDGPEKVCRTSSATDNKNNKRRTTTTNQCRMAAAL